MKKLAHAVYHKAPVNMKKPAHTEYHKAPDRSEAFETVAGHPNCNLCKS